MAHDINQRHDVDTRILEEAIDANRLCRYWIDVDQSSPLRREGDALTLVNHVLTPTTPHHWRRGFSPV